MSKYLQSLEFASDLDSADTIVTDSAAPAELGQALRERGLEVIVAPVA
jgi:hypothetical protein